MRPDPRVERGRANAKLIYSVLKPWPPQKFDDINVALELKGQPLSIKTVRKHLRALIADGKAARSGLSKSTRYWRAS